MIQPGWETINLVHSNLLGPYIMGLYRAKYYIIYLYNTTKQSETSLLKEKSGVPPAFKRSCLTNEKRDKRVQCLRMNGSGKYDSNEFTEL